MSSGADQSNSSARRILTRNKPNEEDASQRKQDNKSPSINQSPTNKSNLPKENKENTTDSSTSQLQQQQQQQQFLAVNYINKEPFNEDVELEETPLNQDSKWRQFIIESFKNLVGEIKELQSNPTAENKNLIKEKYKRGLLICSSLKKFNRASQIKVNKARIKTHEEKNKIDEYHLELQNLLYEISHLKKEINKCLEFRSADEDINLISVEDFYAKAPPEVSRPEITRNSEHQLKLARLDWELMERQNMLGRIKELESQIELNEKRLKAKQDKIDSLHPKLNQIIEASKPALEYFNANFTDDFSLDEKVQYLPKPLYQFFMMMSAFIDTIDKDIAIEINGDLEEAKRFNLNETISNDEDDSDSANEDDENEHYQKKKSKSKQNKKKSSSKDKIFNPYPLSCKVLVTVKNYGRFTLELFYLNILKIITVKSSISLQHEIPFYDNPILKAENIFNCLYENDTGLESPNPGNKFLLNNMGIKSIEPYTKSVGMAYKWCQILCGLFYENKFDRHNFIYSSQSTTSARSKLQEELNDKRKNPSEEKMITNDDSTPGLDKSDKEMETDEKNEEVESDLKASSNNDTKLFEKIISKLKSRFKARVMLQETLNSLKNLNVPSSECYSVENLRFKVQSTIKSFTESTFDKYSSLAYTKQFLDSKLAINENNCAFFELNLQNSNATLQAQIVINIDYPRVTPLFSLNVTWKHERNHLNDEAIRDMECELNLFKDNQQLMDNVKEANKMRRLNSMNRLSNEEKNNDILAKQINHLLICFDIYLESESYSLNNFEFPRVKLFQNSVRGRDRKRPFCFISNRDLFMQRMHFDSNESN